MFFAFGDLLLEEEFGPGAVQDGLIGVLEEALMDEMGPAPTAMDPVLGSGAGEAIVGGRKGNSVQA